MKCTYKTPDGRPCLLQGHETRPHVVEILKEPAVWTSKQWKVVRAAIDLATADTRTNVFAFTADTCAARAGVSVGVVRYVLRRLVAAAVITKRYSVPAIYRARVTR